MRDFVLIGSGWLAGSIVTGIDVGAPASLFVAFGCGCVIGLIRLAYDHWAGA